MNENAKLEQELKLRKRIEKFSEDEEINESNRKDIADFLRYLKVHMKLSPLRSKRIKLHEEEAK